MSNREKDFIREIQEFFEAEIEVYGPLSFDFKNENEETEEESTKEIKSDPGKSAEKVEEPIKPTPAKTVSSLTLQEKLDTCSTLDELRQLCEKADELHTDLKGTHLVFGVGNPNADLMLIGEAPGEQEDIQGEPFVGPAGQLLNKILAAINFNREDIYIANILKHRPPGNRNPNPEERLRSLPFLLRQIDIIQPKLILCLGKISGTTLLNRDDSLRNMRGSFHPFRGAELTVTYHPAALLRKPQWKRPAWEDVQMVRKRYDELGCKP